jgi:hypothetical protein
MINELREEAVKEGECKTEAEIEECVFNTIILIANVKEVERKYGKKRADMANYGWFTDGNGKDTKISTKVYGNPCMIVVSWWDGKKVVHQHNPY